MQTGLKPVWAGRNMRLDPFRLPQVVSYATRDEQGDVTFMIDQRGAVIRRILEKSGLPVTSCCRHAPSAASLPVPSRTAEGNGHGDARAFAQRSAASVPLLVADDLDDIAADWRTWAEEYRLPMLLIEADGIARTLEESLGGGESRSLQRAPQARGSRRRPRFLARRKAGDLGLRLVIGGEEIIARK